MRNIFRLISLGFVMTVLTAGIANAELYRYETAVKNSKTQKAAECVPATGSSQLNVNNVRAYITTAGSMWFNNSTAQYFVPKEGKASSMFAAALWIGGQDMAGQLKVAAVRFRQRGNDFWPGPLTLTGANVDQSTCAVYDKIFYMTKQMARDHRDKFGTPGYTIPEAIMKWPGNPQDGSAGQSPYLAPYVDLDGNGAYNPENGDYPYYDFDNKLCPWSEENRLKAARGELDSTMETKRGISTGGIMADQVLKGDATLWWVFNDKGAAHTESNGIPIGLEIRAQAFGFATTDELNNMTFYSYEIINRSTQDVAQTFFSQWVDPDVGESHDDYIGCDVERGLGYCYNGKTPDGSGKPTDYGANPPAVGVDFFQGPYLDPDGEDNPSYMGDGIHGPSYKRTYPDAVCGIVQSNGNAMMFTWDSIGRDASGEEVKFPITRNVTVRAEAINGVNFGDGIVDNERYGMRRFVYHNNESGSSPTSDPVVAIDYYNLLRGIWRDNARMTFGGTGWNPGSSLSCDFMFPGDTDPCNWGTNGVAPNYTKGPRGWTEEAEGNRYGDRRFMQSAGPFTLKAGAINYITVGIPWARAVGAPWASVQLLKIVDDKAQKLFENCFKSLEGPIAPDLIFREMDGKLICYITNPKNSMGENYKEFDNTIAKNRITTTRKTMDSLVVRYMPDTLISQSGLNDSVVFRRDTIIVPTYVDVVDTIPFDQYYHFEGYQIYQLADQTVKAGELGDETKAQLVFQCDIKNGVEELINYKYNAIVATEVPQRMVLGEDKGIRHSFTITEDKFAYGTSTNLVNYKKYYYMAVAYAYNCSYPGKPYSTDPNDPEAMFGQKNPYLASNHNVKPYTVIPHKNAIEENGTVIQASFGTQPQIIQFEGQGNGGNNVQLSKKTLTEILANGKADSLIFEKDHGPIDVKVVDPLKVLGKEYTLRFCNRDGSMATAVTDSTYWVLEYTTDSGVDTAIFSDTSINVPNEQILFDLGISIFVKNAKFTPLDENLKSTNETVYKLFSTVDFIASSIDVQPGSVYFGWPDDDGTGPLNWIRSGQTSDGDWKMRDQTWKQVRKEDFYIQLKSTDPNMLKDVSHSEHTIWLDNSKKFDKIGFGFAPYALTSYYDENPAYGYEVCENEYSNPAPKRANDPQGGNPVNVVYPLMTELYSVDIVLTADKSLWTRCPVVEIACDNAMTINNAIRHDLRKSPSVDKDGKPDGSGRGMGWFPGYAICVETGERLNMMFGENSTYGQYNGADMIFNPSSDFFGRHFIYVFGHRDLYKDRSNLAFKWDSVASTRICPAYDEGKWLYEKLKHIESLPATNTSEELTKATEKNYIYKNVMWTGIARMFSVTQGNDITMQIRVSRPYQRWTSTTNTGKVNHENNNMPLYRFSTKDIATKFPVKNVAQSQMDSIYITPNPYYGISTGGYEPTSVDTRVKFVNIPKKCTIKIYTLNGTLVHTIPFESPDRNRKSTPRDPNPDPNAITYVEWDLKNTAKIPIASGMYLIHVQDEEYKTVKTLKFLCIQRPVDVNAF